MRVVNDVSKEPLHKGELFSGCSFWIAQRVPDRYKLVKLVTYNGGTIVPVESRANYLIVDHLRDGLPSGAISYRFILDSVENVELEDVETHRCGPPAGSGGGSGLAGGPRYGRVAFTRQDDYDLYRHVRYCQKRGVPVKGNEIYKRHQELYPRHSFHSYRDRWIKILSQKRPAGIPVPTPSPEPSLDLYSTPKENGKFPTTFALQKSSNSGPRLTKLSFGGSPREGSTSVIDEQLLDLPALVDQFRLQDFHDLSGAGDWIEGAQAADYDGGWDKLARDPERPSHTAAQWRTFWEYCVKPVYEKFGKDKKKLQIYDDAFDRWEKKFGPDASIRNWVVHFRREVDPKLQEQSTAQYQGAAPSSPVRQPKEPLVNDHSKDLGIEEHSTSSAQQAKVHCGSLALDRIFSSPIQNSRGKRGREDDSDVENGTPASKKIRTNGHSGENDKFHDSIEFSPTKKLASSPLGERKLIQVGSERSSSSSSSDLFVSNHSKSKAPAFQTLFEEEEKVQERGEGEQDETQAKVEDQDNQFEEPVRKALGGLDEQQVHELLELLRTAPFAPPEFDDMTPFDAAVMHTIQVLTVGDPSVDEWYQFSAIFYKKLQELNIFDELFSDDESDEGDEEQDVQNENSEQDVQNENSEQGILNNVETNDLVAHEPTPARDSLPPRDPTPQPQSPSQLDASLDTTSTFTDSYTHIDDDAFDDPNDLDSGDAAEAYIDTRINPPYAFAEDEIVAALHATCACSSTFADRVLGWMRKNSAVNSKGKARCGRRSSILPTGKFLPVMPGVWTDEDDKAVLGEADPEEQQRIERKHGLERCEQRRRFLRSVHWEP